MPVRGSHSTTGHDTSAFMYTYGGFRVVDISAVGVLCRRGSSTFQIQTRSFSERQLADIDLTLVTRLAAFAKF
jgi:hypothetical protein